MNLVRIAGAPISWGVSEVPGWGFQLAPDRVLAEMREVGIIATEFGPLGFLPDGSEHKVEVLSKYGLLAVGGFVPLVLHRPDSGLIASVSGILDDFVAANAEVLVLAAVTGDDGYDAARPELDASEWATLFTTLETLRDIAAERGVLAVLHPHAGTVVASAADVERVLAGTKVGLCFDTGHLMIGGVEPVEFVRRHADRIQHVHLKDVSIDAIERVRSGELSYQEAVRQDALYRPLGQGDVDIRAILTSLRRAGYDGWYVLEQDRILSGEPRDGEGPIDDVRASIDYLRSVLERDE